MLTSEQIHAELNNLGFRLEAGKSEPSYAYEHLITEEVYLYVKRNRDGRAVSTFPLVLPPSSMAMRTLIDDIDGLEVRWEVTKSTSYRRFPKDNGTSQYGYAANLQRIAALPELIAALVEPGSTVAPQGADNEVHSYERKVDSMYPLNQILYGPPGTGKTYATTELAVRLAEPQWYQATHRELVGDERRQAIKAKYDRLVREQRVVLTTFHQSFSYEDFVEGIRATTDEQTGGIRYEVVDGIFKQMCENADVTVEVAASETIELGNRRIWKMSLGNTQQGEEYIFDECIENGYVLLGYGHDIDFSDCHSRRSIKARLGDYYGETVNNNDYAVTAVNTFKNLMQQGDLVIVSDGNHKFRAIAEVTGDYEFLKTEERVGFQQCRPVKWLRQYSPSLPKERLFLKSLSQMTVYELKPTTVDLGKLEQLLAPTREESEQRPHVLIIDEINRGNISRIFGELITLLEPSKRKGAADAQTAVLPYSKDPFTVPINVYLIGTMNTADKSLAQLDLALRRRFSFVEMLPQPELLRGTEVYGIDLADLLTMLNQRIEVLLDAEHLIGHSYFLPLTHVADDAERQEGLAALFENKLLPLLQEYFFDDYQRIGWVLNDPAKQPADRFILTHEASQEMLRAVGQLFPAEIAEQLMDSRYRINTSAFAREGAYRAIMV
ncbi:AAA family ATPase [Litchfieldella xinjiangensis]|uniref:AAA family ATPase n=1 Tax=Litchfieldella xinjiangensis TaxID=1166948 RepID=UPI0005BC6D74|nr:AAA family ATPase [Halomonas xinjiangensis]